MSIDVPQSWEDAPDVVTKPWDFYQQRLEADLAILKGKKNRNDERALTQYTLKIHTKDPVASMYKLSDEELANYAFASLQELAACHSVLLFVLWACLFFVCRNVLPSIRCRGMNVGVMQVITGGVLGHIYPELIRCLVHSFVDCRSLIYSPIFKTHINNVGADWRLYFRILFDVMRAHDCVL